MVESVASPVQQKPRAGAAHRKLPFSQSAVPPQPQKQQVEAVIEPTAEATEVKVKRRRNRARRTRKAKGGIKVAMKKDQLLRQRQIRSKTPSKQQKQRKASIQETVLAINHAINETIEKTYQDVNETIEKTVHDVKERVMETCKTIQETTPQERRTKLANALLGAGKLIAFVAPVILAGMGRTKKSQGKLAYA